MDGLGRGRVRWGRVWSWVTWLGPGGWDWAAVLGMWMDGFHDRAPQGPSTTERAQHILKSTDFKICSPGAAAGPRRTRFRMWRSGLTDAMAWCLSGDCRAPKPGHSEVNLLIRLFASKYDNCWTILLAKNRFLFSYFQIMIKLRAEWLG